MSFFASFLRHLPCYRIDLSEHAVKNGEAVLRLLQRLPHRPRSSFENTPLVGFGASQGVLHLPTQIL